MIKTQYFINRARLEEIKNGRNAGQKYLNLTVVEAGTGTERSVPVFTQSWIDIYNEAVNNNGEKPDFGPLMLNNVFDVERIPLGGEYYHFREENGQRVYDTNADGSRIKYRTMNVLVLYHHEMEEATDADGVIIYIGINAQGVGVPKMKYVMDETKGGKKRFYARGWSPEERRDAALQLYYERADSSAEAQPIETPIMSGDPNAGAAAGATVVNNVI